MWEGRAVERVRPQQGGRKLGRTVGAVTQEAQDASKSTSGKARGGGLGRDGVGQRELLTSVWPRKEGD